jgi:hypothetical protein
MAEVSAHELILKEEQEARRKAMDEIKRDCDPASAYAKQEKQDEEEVTLESGASERTKQ